MRVRAKFYVYSVTKITCGNVTVQLKPVINGSEENKSFWKYTPAGSIEMQMTAGIPAAEQFEAGQEFYVDFTPATE